MPDPVVPATTEVTPPVTAPEAAPAVPSVLDEIKASMAADDGPEPVAPVAPVTAEVTPPAPAATAAETKETAEALAEALPELTDEQVAKLANDSRIVGAVLRGDTGKQTLNEMFTEVLAEKETEVRSKVEKETLRTAAAKTLSEALKEAEDSDNYDGIGRVLVDNLKTQQAEAETQRTLTEAEAKIKKSAMDEVLGGLDTAVETVYGDVINTLTQEELAGIGRGNFKSDAEFMAGVLKLFDTKRTEMVRSGATTAIEATAAETAAAAAHVRSQVGVGALPGGSGVETIGDSLSDLIRQGMKGAPGLDDESD